MMKVFMKVDKIILRVVVVSVVVVVVVMIEYHYNINGNSSSNSHSSNSCSKSIQDQSGWSYIFISTKLLKIKLFELFDYLM